MRISTPWHFEGVTRRHQRLVWMRYDEKGEQVWQVTDTLPPTNEAGYYSLETLLWMKNDLPPTEEATN